MATGMPSTSKYTLDDDPSVGARSIQVAQFRIESTKLPILTIPEADHASNELDLALPEIIFGNNRLTITHEPSLFRLEWNTLDMLRAVKKGHGWEKEPASGALRVAHADEWSRGQSSTNSTSNMTIVKPFDWTYTTLHPGTTTLPSNLPSPEWTRAPPTHPGIPLALLARTDIPILFFEEVPLFEDELGDNGIADVTIRVRVNATSFYVLARYALRIDHVLFRHFDVRVYHEFGTTEIVRELKGRQSSYDQVKSRLAPTHPKSSRLSGAGGGGSRVVPNPQYPNISIPSRTPLSASPSTFSSFSTARRSTPTSTDSTMPPPPPAPVTNASMMTPEDLTKLTDPNWVAGVLEQIALEDDMEGFDPLLRRNQPAADGGGADADERGEWGGKGKRLEVLKVPW